MENECLVCHDVSDSIICEECQARHEIDINELEEMNEVDFNKRLREGFALLEADEKPGGYDFYWS